MIDSHESARLQMGNTCCNLELKKICKTRFEICQIDKTIPNFAVKSSNFMLLGIWQKRLLVKLDGMVVG
jgi:hypothetical protein